MSSSSDPESIVGLKLADRYQIVELLGRGGMGSVYLARDAGLDREVAVKILTFASAQPQFQDRFENEARIVAKMDHPSIVPVYDFGRDHGLR